MGTGRRLAVAALLLLACGSVRVARADRVGTNAAELRGQVVSPTGQPIDGATVTIILVEGTSWSALTDRRGRYRLVGLPPGPAQVLVVVEGQVDSTVLVELRAGAVVDLDVRVRPLAGGETVVITGARTPEKIVDSAMTVQAVSAEQMQRLGGGSYLDTLRDVNGLHLVNLGVYQQRIAARGFENQFRMITLLDGRLASLPGIGTPQLVAMPVSTLDIKSMEVVLGPASALYGANAHSGVVNVLSKSPWDEQGVSLSLRGGTQQLVDGAVRAAGVVGQVLGWKVNGKYLQAQDFEPDPDQPMHYFGTSFFEKQLVDGYRVGGLEVDGSLQYRARDWTVAGTAGWSETTGFSTSDSGRNYVDGFQVAYQSLTLTHPSWYAQITRTHNDAGDSYQIQSLARRAQASADMGLPVSSADLARLREEVRVVDTSQMFEAELQHNRTVGPVRTVVGSQGRLYQPESEGTLYDDGGDRDISVQELGAYLQLDYWPVPERLRVVGAARVDAHSDYSTQLSPQVSLMLSPTPNQRLRLAYNRAFQSPGIIHNYLLVNGFMRGNRDGFTVRDAQGELVGEIAGLEPETVDAVELGYKASLADAVAVSAVLHNSWYDAFISPLTAVANPMAAEPTFAHTADGTLVGEGTPFAGFLLTYVNFGEAFVQGLDIELDAVPHPKLGLSVGGSLITLVDFDANTTVVPELPLNMPRLKLRASATVENVGLDHSYVRVGGRYRTGFVFDAGYWNSREFFADGTIPAQIVVDVSAGRTWPQHRVAVRAYLLNALGNDIPDVLGAPVPGRLAYLQVAYSY
jgi:outer membrane receptor for ferrienterochelin and colicins